MIIKSQLATLLTSVSLGKTPQTILSPRVSSGDPGLTIAQTHMDTKLRSWEVGGDEIRFRERSLIEGSESIASLGLHETRE